MDKADLKFGDYFRKGRLDMHLTQEAFSEMIGITVSYYKDIERNVAVPSLKVFLQIVTTLNLSLDEIIYAPQNSSAEYQRLNVLLNQCSTKQLSVLLATAQALLDTSSDTNEST